MKITRNNKKTSSLNLNSSNNISTSNFIISLDYSLENLYQILIKNPLLVNKEDKKGETLLSYSIERNKNDIFDLILTSPILDLKYQNKEGNSYLHIAVQYERENMIIKLIKKGIFLNFQNNDGNTALHFAHLIGNTNIIKILIENNIDFTLKNNLGEIAEQCYTGNNKSNSNVDYDILSDSDINDDLIKQNDNNNLETKTNKLIKFSDDNIINKNREFNLSLSDRFNNYNKIKSQNIYFKKKENIINNEENNINDNLNISLESNEINKKLEDDDDLYSLTSSLDNQRKSNLDKINISSTTNQNTNTNHYHINTNKITEDDDIVNINNNEICGNSIKRNNFSVLNKLNNYDLTNNIDLNINNNINNERINYQKIFSDTTSTIKPKVEINEDFIFSSPYIEVLSQMINENNNNNNQLNNFMPAETKLKISLPDIRKVPYLNTSNNPIPIPNKDNSNNKTNNLFQETIISNPLLDFLNSINLKKYYKNLSTNGFDDINLIIEQTKENFLGITNENLKEAGIINPGERAKIIIKVQELANNFSYEIPKEVYYTCLDLKNSEKDINIIKLNKWLKSMNVGNLLNNFISNGYHSLELLLIQIYSKDPLTNEKLRDDLGIDKIGFRQRIINKLKDDGIKFQKKLKNKNVLVIEQNKNKEICNECNIF